jgi:PPM family protein phosphatase
MISAHATHTGMVRQNNEDFIRTDDSIGIYLLADGIGGNNAGEVASSLAVETVYRVLRTNISHTEADGYFELMFHALNAAHWEVHSTAQSDPALKKMGTTLVAALLRDSKAYIVNAGDSRCYMLQHRSNIEKAGTGSTGDDRLKRLTHDHTLGNRLLANGIPLEQISRKQFNTLTQSVGCGDPPSPDFNIIELKPGDLLLICSDGLTDMLTDAEIEMILDDRINDLDTLAQALVDAANLKGGRDNISVILVSLP